MPLGSSFGRPGVFFCYSCYCLDYCQGACCVSMVRFKFCILLRLFDGSRHLVLDTFLDGFLVASSYWAVVYFSNVTSLLISFTRDVHLYVTIAIWCRILLSC